MTRARCGSYLLERRIGHGGMAEVFRARARDGAVVVVKRMHHHLAAEPQFMAMFAREARLAARLRHRNIVALLETGERDGEPFLAMEHVDGLDLRVLLREQGRQGRPLPVGAAVQIARDVARALAYAHALTGDDGRPLGIIHRDVTPSNVMVGFDGVVRLIDFGIAKAAEELSSADTRTGVLKGKIGYMAPEQIRAGGEVDARVDVYATGVLLHEMLCGRRLFKAENDARVMGLVLAGNVPPPSAVNPEVPPALDAVCLKALAFERDARYASAGELARALEEALAPLGWSEAQTGALARERTPDEDETQAELTSEPDRATSTATVAKSGRARARVGLIAMAGAVAIAAAAALWLRSRPVAPAVAVPKVAAPEIASPAPTPAAEPPAPSPAATATAASAPPRKRKHDKRHVAADIERGRVIDPFR